MQIYVAHSTNTVSGSLEQEYLTLMPPGICESILKYKRWQDRQATLFGKLLLLRALRRGFPDAGMDKFQSLEATRDGKPFIAGGPEFSISHSEEMVIVAVADSGSVGIDIEKIRTVNIGDFSRDLPEVANLHERYDANQVNNRFFEYWTQKEAVLKGYGKGLLAPLDQVVIGDGTALIYGTTWFIKKIFVAKGYCCHIATDKPIEQVHVEQVNLMR